MNKYEESLKSTHNKVSSRVQAKTLFRSASWFTEFTEKKKDSTRSLIYLRNAKEAHKLVTFCTRGRAKKNGFMLLIFNLRGFQMNKKEKPLVNIGKNDE